VFLMDKEDVKTTNDEVERYAEDIKLSEKRDEDWCEDGKHAIKTFRNGESKNSKGEKSNSFNILWANVETLEPSLYSQIPKPDIRRRFRQEDILGRHVSKVLEDASAYCLEEYGMDNAMESAVHDMLLPGRAVTRIKYKAEITPAEIDDDGNETSPDKVESEEIKIVPWDWDKILLGPAESWEDLPWLAFIHHLDKAQVKDFAEDFADKITYDIASDMSDAKTNKTERIDDRATIYEIWCKEDRKVRWYAQGYKDSFIKVEDDPLSLKKFWPMPKPLYSIKSTTSMVPLTEYSQYEALATTLNTVVVRERRISDSLRVRGIYDGTLSELDKLFDAGDNKMIPAENLARLIESGGIEKAIWMFPNKALVEVLLQLRVYRRDLVQQIYEITGISDIMRGQSDPYETLGAQKMKGSYGSQRLQKRQRAVQKYAKDILKLVVEIIGEKFSIESLAGITGLKFPREAEKQQFEAQQRMLQQQAEQQAMMAQQQAQQSGQEVQPPQQPKVDPEQMRFMSLPTWEDLKGVMEQDLARSYMIDIETDSTVLADQNADQESLTLLLGGVSQYVQGVMPAVESGMMTKEAATALLKSIVSRFRLGREVEEAIENSVNEQGAEQQQQQQEQQAAQQQQQAEQQAEQARQQAESQAKAAENQANQAKYAHEERIRQMEAAIKQQETSDAMQVMQMKRQLAQEKHEQDMMKARMTNEQG